jgi:hypothetical protein
MVTQYDDKGKIFTQVISKKPIPVIIRTSQNTIRGTIHVRPNERVIDELNTANSFIAVTDAIILDEQGTQLYQCIFVSLNKAHIVWIVPDEDVQKS